MDHLNPFQPRKTVSLSPVDARGWHLKRYAIFADNRHNEDAIIAAATSHALDRLPAPGPLDDPTGNHGVGFQIIHFAETAVVSPTFYWQWGSVLAHADQIKAPWDRPTDFRTGVLEIVGCVWELHIVQFESAAWTATMLGPDQTAAPAHRVSAYLGRQAEPSA
ncbi:hypothetical protein [uncultured Tateyamaria sp.]|uniref:hypothetical protein n=1 Tax=Tateyamaria sp. 1078 TaxID=3417464 RepID=UPI002632BEEE|nr:hypothetical protein [uncultured Tateyamaria sp.]